MQNTKGAIFSVKSCNRKVEFRVKITNYRMAHLANVQIIFLCATSQSHVVW